MRKWWGVALIVAVVAIFFWVFLNPSAVSAGNAANAAGSGTTFGIYSSEMADEGNSSAAVLRMYLFTNESGEVLVYCTAQMMQNNMLILEHASAPGIGNSLSDNVAAELAECGFSSRRATAADALSSQNSVIITPTGATPLELLENGAQLSENNNRVIVLESLKGRAIDSRGVMTQGENGAGFEIVSLEPNEDVTASAQAARLALFAPGARPTALHPNSENFTVAVPAPESAYCRAVFIGSGGACRYANTGMLSSQAGRLSGPIKVNAGQSAAYEFQLANGTEEGRRLRFFAAWYQGKSEAGRKEIAGGEIVGGFASRFALNFSLGGAYVVRILDQFGRAHASAYVEADGLSVEIVSQQGNRYEYIVLFGGEPAEGAVKVWIDSGAPNEYYASNGRLIVWAAPSTGSHTMNFEYKGLKAQGEFFAPGGGLVDTYIRIGIPAAIFVLAVVFLLRAGKKAKYCITFPQFAEREQETVGATAEEIAAAWEKADGCLGGHHLPIYPEEMANALLGMQSANNLCISEYSMQRALRELSNRGIFAECNGAFIPLSCAGGFSPSELFALRLIHDLLLERGIRFARKRTVPVKNADLELSLFSG
ncbi:MAG: hypothetical protein NTV88_06055, partial [Candidatus Micrarchaeota archaeon]|nr:hypothetical protein [Candidatus Micrarchaeota archaeon]